MKKFELNQIIRDSDRREIISSLCISNSVHISIAYKSDFQNAKILREFLDDLCKQFQIHPRWRTRLVLVIDELNNNAIEYGSKKWDINYLNLHLTKWDGSCVNIIASVTDTGKWPHAKNSIDMEALRKKHAQEDFSKHTSIRWRGLFLIISRLVDDLYFQDAPSWGLIVGVKKTLN